VQLAEEASFYVKTAPLDFDDKARQTVEQAKPVLAQIRDALAALPAFEHDAMEAACRDIAAREHNNKLGAVLMPLRAAITGRTVSPPLFRAMEILGRDACLERIGNLL